MVCSILVVCAFAATCECPCEGCVKKPPREPSDSENTSASLKIVSYDPRFPSQEVHRIAESQRAHLYWHWHGSAKPPVWDPPCLIVVHANRASYAAAVGRGSESTYGSSLIDNRDCKCSSRRIDLLVDLQGKLSALPHEMTHVAISDMLGGRYPPRWLDEGIALLADSVNKQHQHYRDMAASSSGQRHKFRAADLMLLEDYPAASRVPAFYAQSASLTAFLARRGEPTQLLKFAQVALDKGYDEALRNVYQLDGIAALEQAWLADAPETIAYSLARTRIIP